jgi:hypothetical protein
MSLDTDFDDLLVEVAGVDPQVLRARQISALLKNARLTNSSLVLLHAELSSLKGSVEVLASSIEKQQAELSANTSITTNIRDLLTTGKVMTKILKGLAGILLTCAALWGAWYGIAHSGAPAPTIGPLP